MDETTKNQMLGYYAGGHAYAGASARDYLERGDLEKASAWQNTQRAWFQHRAILIDAMDATLDSFSLDDASRAHYGQRYGE